MPTAQFLPTAFVNRLTVTGLSVAGHPGPVLIRRYLCAVRSNGGNANAARLMSAIRRVVRDTPDAAAVHAMGQGFTRVFTGQGKPELIQAVLALAWRYRDQLRDYRTTDGERPFARHFLDARPLQALADDKMVGLDCVGFVGRYLEAAGVFRAYHSWYPRNYLDSFRPITALSQLEPLCVLVWANGSHVAIVDSIQRRTRTSATVTVCESSAGGPQTNVRVRLEPTTARWLDFGEYGAAVTREHADDARRRELRAQLTHEASATGYQGGVLLAHAGGTPAVPVPGAVYAGKLPNLRVANAEGPAAIARPTALVG